jgi:hypothetical protein
MAKQSAQPVQEQGTTEVAPVLPQPLTLQQRALVALGGHDEAALKKLVEGTKDITVITNAAGYQQVHAARMVLKNERIAIEKDGKKAREEAVAFGKAVIVEQDRLIAITASEEQRLQGLQDDWDDARKREKEAKEAAERARIAAIQERIDWIRQQPLEAAGESAAEIEQRIQAIVALPIDGTFAELEQQAEGAKATTLIRLRAAHAKALALEAEQKRLAEERAELARQKAEEEARQAAERARIAEAQRLENEVLARERARMAEEERVAREAREKEAAEQRARLAEEERQARAARERDTELERQRLAREEAALERRQEAQRAESARLEEERKQRQREQEEADVARQAEAQRIADDRAQLERDQEALRMEREAKPAADPVLLYGTQPADSSGLSNAIVTETDVPALAARLQAIDSVLASTEPADPLLMTIRLTEYLPMESVCKAAKEWAVFQEAASKADQKTDRKLAARARESVNNLLIAVEQLPQGAAA